MFGKLLYLTAAALLALSFWKDRKKTKKALKKAWKSFENILPQLLAVLLIIGMTLAVADESMISRLLGQGSGLWGMAAAAIIGSVTLVPAFVAFPLAGTLLRSGAGLGQIAMFISTLTMVGLVTLPAESACFGRKAAVCRNVLALVWSVALAFVMGGLFG